MTGLTGVLTSTVTYVERVVLSPDAVVEVTLQDVSRADAPATITATQTIETNGAQVPIPYELQYDPAQIDPKHTCSVAARITVDGQLRWINTQPYPVLTRGAPTDNVEIIVRPVP